MPSETDRTLFVKVTPATYKRLAVLAAKIGMPKGQFYFHAIDWASRQPKFRELMVKVYDKKS